MHLEALEIHNFRGIKECKSALPNKRVLCLIGAGDSTKSTILDAVFLNLLPNWNINATDSDFYEGDTSKAITISCTYSEFPEAFLAEDKFGFYLRSGAAICSSFLVDNVGTSWDDEIRNGENGCLTLRLTIDSSLEPKWEIICNRLQPKSIGVTDRRALLCSFIGTEINGDFSWGRNSILHRYADGKGELRSAYQDAFRAAAQVVHFNSLDSISDAVITAGKQYSVPIEGVISNQMAMRANGFSTDVELFDGKVPFLQRGLGSKRLMSIGLNANATDGAALLLIDEVETGLEPFRVCQLISELKRTHTCKGQVLMTTHNSNVISELSADELLIVNSKSGITTINTIDPNDTQKIQGILRKFPEAFLSKRIIVCEGKTEVGFIRALDGYLVTMKGFHLAHKGICPIDGAGGNSAIQLAKRLKSFGYDVCILMDSDTKNDNGEKPDLKEKGITVFDWDDGNSIEEQIFFDVPDLIAEKILATVVDESNIDSRLLSLNMIYETCKKVDGKLVLAEGIEPDQRKFIGTIAKNKNENKPNSDCSWYKRIDHGEEIGSIIFGSLNEISERTRLRTTIDSLIEWVNMP
jgi:putative ATP-dependent endonuclease of OLD family